MLLFLDHPVSCYRIDDEFHIKITDCALSRDLFPMDYHCLGDNENKPVKWMAVESLEQHRFTTASDVVSNIFHVVFVEVLGLVEFRCIDLNSILYCRLYVPVC